MSFFQGHCLESVTANEHIAAGGAKARDQEEWQKAISRVAVDLVMFASHGLVVS
eukprot:m.853703 g.853703  ORF g.853703 m.853703 type:complete len:54 (-) comp59612_c1_seq4:2656-2817(-)